MASPDEAELLARARAGDREAQRVLFESLAPRARAMALHALGGDAATADDVVQEAFVALFTKGQPFRGEASLTTWLYRLIVNRCIDLARRRRRLVPLLRLVGRASAEAAPLQRAEAGERERAVRAAVADLPPKLRVAVLLRHFEELSYEEMAQVLDCSPGTVASRLSRGHAALARALAPMGFAR